MNESTWNFFKQLHVDYYNSIRFRSIDEANASKVKAILPIQVLKQTNLGCFDVTGLCKIYACAIK